MKCKRNSNFYFIRQLTFIIFTSLLLAQTGFAASVSKLYEASIEADSGRGENQLIAEAFTQVLIKVSGRSDVAASPAYSAMLKQAEAAIAQFRYDYRVVSGTDTGASKKTEPQQVKQKWFWISFNSKKINSLLTQAQIPVWGKVRPETLIWFSQETQGKRYLQGQHDTPEIYELFKQQADKRGIALTFPFLDLQDQSSVSASDIWGNFNDAILLASRRYHAQSTLTSRLFKEPSGLWVSQWNLLMLGEVQSWEIRDETLERALASGIDELADKLSRQFTQVVREGNSATVLVQINNIGGFKNFQQVDDYLRNLATVKSVTLAKMDQDKVMYTIHYLGSKNALIQEISLGDLLNSVELSGAADGRYNSNASNNNSYKPVILDDLDKHVSAQGGTTQLSDREKALAALEKASDGKVKAMPLPQTSTAPTIEKIAEKTVQPLRPELEYWLTR